MRPMYPPSDEPDSVRIARNQAQARWISPFLYLVPGQKLFRDIILLMTLSRLIPALFALPLAAQAPPAIENDQVRVIRVRMAAHRKVPLHEHALNRVVVYLTDQKGSMTTDGKTDTAQHQAGDASWGGPVKHSEENLKDTPFEGVVVELKR